MREPLVQLLRHQQGLLFSSTGVVVIKETSERFNEVIQNPPKDRTEDFELVLTYNHEAVHFIQSLVYGYLHNYNAYIYHEAKRVLGSISKLRSIPKGSLTEFEAVSHSLKRRAQSNVSCHDILEAVAMTEAFKLTDTDPTYSRYLAYLKHYAGIGTESPYRRAYDELSKVVGGEHAFHLLSPISFIAFQGSDPVASFNILLKEHLPQHNLNDLSTMSIKDLFEAFDMNSDALSFYHLDKIENVPEESRLIDSLKHAVNTFGVDKLMDVAAHPHRCNSILTADEISAILPLMRIHSSPAGKKLTVIAKGIAKESKELRELLILYTAMLGAAERLTFLRDEDRLYRLCQHGDKCEHFTSGLCYRYFTPPSYELGHEMCRFIPAFERMAGMSPSEAWSLVNS